jgi:large subunit ribosomal protein L1
VQFRIDKAGIIHCGIGKASFGADALKENLTALLAAVNKAKPSTSKGVYLKKLTLSTTMGPGVRVDTATLPA